MDPELASLVLSLHLKYFSFTHEITWSELISFFILPT